jgi:hypothetical protein
MDKPIQMPVIVKRRNSNEVFTLGGELGLPNGANTFAAGSIVVFDGMNLAKIASQAVLACGISPDASQTANVISAPYALKADRHWPFSIAGLQFLINIGHLNGTDVHVGAAGGAKQLSDVAIGTSYGVAVPTTGTYAGIPFLDPTNTTQLLLTVVDKPTVFINPESKQTAATYNAQVLVEVISTCVQNIG